MRKIIDYYLINNPLYEPQSGYAPEKHFAETVRDLILKGWQPLGGLTPNGRSSDNDKLFIQAMVKYEET